MTVSLVAIAAAWSAPDDAAATPTLATPRTSAATHLSTLVVHTPAFVRAHTPCAIRHRFHAQPDPELGDATIDHDDPWTGEPPRPELAAAPRDDRPLDANDPWTGEPISGFGAVALRPSTLDPWEATSKE